MAIYNNDDLLTQDYLFQEGWECERNEDGDYIYRLSNIYQFVIIQYNRYDTDFYIDGTDIQIKYIRHYLEILKICKEEND